MPTLEAQIEQDLITKLVDLDKKVKAATDEHNKYLRELGLPELPK